MGRQRIRSTNRDGKPRRVIVYKNKVKDIKDTIVPCSDVTCRREINCPNFQARPEKTRDKTYFFPSCIMHMDTMSAKI